jgi:hypothetical protein
MREIVWQFHVCIPRRLGRYVGLGCRGEGVLVVAEILTSDTMVVSRSSELYCSVGDLGSVVSRCQETIYF